MAGSSSYSALQPRLASTAHFLGSFVFRNEILSGECDECAASPRLLSVLACRLELSPSRAPLRPGRRRRGRLLTEMRNVLLTRVKGSALSSGSWPFRCLSANNFLLAQIRSPVPYLKPRCTCLLAVRQNDSQRNAQSSRVSPFVHTKVWRGRHIAMFRFGFPELVRCRRSKGTILCKTSIEQRAGSSR